MAVRVAVLLSGRGSNMVALAQGIERVGIPARIVLVLSNRESAAGLQRARKLGIEAVALSPSEFPTREAHEEEMISVLREARVEWICLAGYMRLLGPGFIRAFPRRVLNIHPSLLPSFPGLHAQQQALDHGVRVSGCTVHLVDEGLDDGPIVVQRTVPVLESDDEASLSLRILEQEHGAYCEALARLLGSSWRLSGRRVLFEDSAKEENPLRSPAGEDRGSP
jgi:phosphoribosylglycinamide formyltransferase-1